MSNESQTHITQSIYVSQSQPNRNIQSRHPPKKQNAFILNQTNDQPFIHYYQENIKLKKKQDQMAKQMLQLKGKLNEQTNKNRTLNERDLKILANTKKSAWDNKNSRRQPSNTHYKQDSQKTEHLLEIIDHYKQKMLVAEEEIQNLKRKIHLLEQDVKVKQKKSEHIYQSFQKQSSGHHEKVNLAEQLKNNVKQFQLQKERNKYNEAQIKRLETKLRTFKIKEDEFDHLKLQNRNLQEKLLRLTSMSSFGDALDRVDEERKVRQIQSKYKLISQKYTNLKNQNIKVEADLKLLQNKLVEVSHEASSLQKQNAALKQKSFSNPVLQRLSNNPELLSKVVYQIEQENRPKYHSKLQRQSYEQIVMEKQELANEIISLRAKMQALQDTWKEREREAKIQKQQMMTMIQKQNIHTKGQSKVVSKNGIPYSDDVSMFSQDNSKVAGNSFDLFLGELFLMETMIKSSVHVKNTQALLVVAAVDFYNHDTVNTICQTKGGNTNLQSQFTFAVTEDEFFFKYLNKGNFYIDIWATEGNNKHHLGKATVDLRSLINKSKPKISPVVSASAPIYLEQRVMGSINFVMRMRLPIHDKVERITQIGNLLDPEERAQNRRLIIHIQEGKGFTEHSNTFVYYPFRLQDFYTKTYKGSNPVWNHHKSMDLKYNDDLKNYLRKNQLELAVLDDNALFTGNEGSDFVGNAYVSLIPLLQNKIIKERLPIMKGNQKIGTLDIRIFWHNTESFSKKSHESQAVNEVHELHAKINEYIKVHRYDPQDIFRLVDKNRTGMISFNEFHVWAIKVCPGTHIDVINKYYNTFKQPVNLLNFVSKLGQKMQDSVHEIAREMSMINEFMKKNTTQIKKRETLQQFLKGKDIVQISLDIDKSQNGKISKEQLQQYFDMHNIEASIDQQQIFIVDFLKKYQSFTQ